MKKSEWLELIPELKNPDTFSSKDELDLIIEQLAKIRQYTVELYNVLSKIPLGKLEHKFAPVKLQYKHNAPRQLRMIIPLPLPTIKVLSYCIDARNRGAVMQYSLLKEYWYSLVSKIIEKGHSNGILKDFYCFEKAIVKVKFCEIDLRTRDADNYCLVLLHNALVRTGIIADDNFERLKYCVSGIGGCDSERTEVVIVEDQ